MESGIFTFKDCSENLLKNLEPEYEAYHDATDVELDDITMETKLVVGPGIIAKRFDEESFFNTILGFTPHWDYKIYHEYISYKIINLSTTNKIHLKNVVINGSLVNDLGQPILFSFVLEEPSRYEVFCESETIHYKKVNKSVLNTVTFYFEDDNHKEVNFNGDALTFILQLSRI